MGPGSIAWLASGPTVAASALDLTITDPRPLLERISPEELSTYVGSSPSRPRVKVVEPVAAVDGAAGENGGDSEAVPGSGRAIDGRAQLFGDHVDTDAMIPGEFCHLTHPDEIGSVAFHYVRPDFGERIARGESILVAGEGWGSGSSREHAVWALKYAGVQAIVAKSFAFIHKRNLVNEAVPFVVLTDPEFYERIRDGEPLSISAETGVVRMSGHDYQAESVSNIAFRIQSAGGIVPAVQKHGKDTFNVLTAGAHVG
jgi:aconitate hydratase/homoaconitate hydratase